MIVGAIIGAVIGWLIWGAANRGHFEAPNFWVWDRKMGFFRGLGIVIVCAAIGAGVGAVLSG